jgi:hypothetical protein
VLPLHIFKMKFYICNLACRRGKGETGFLPSGMGDSLQAATQIERQRFLVIGKKGDTSAAFY